MSDIVSVTSQGQMSIPAKIRRELNIDRKKVEVRRQDNGFFVEPIVDILSLKGSLKTNKKPLSNKELDEVVAQAVAEEYKEKMKKMGIKIK